MANGEQTEKNGIVISSRARLARNLAGYAFPSRLNSEDSLAITQKVYSALGKGAEKYTIMRISDLSELQGEAFKEMHLVSDDLLHGNKYAAAIVNPNNEICVMVNEEDHIRAQCILRGNRLDEAYRRINDVDDLISASNKYAFDAKLGYLTACPTNVGTGLRASALMFLPGLSLTRSLESCMNAVSRYDMTIRGEYGEGSESEGYLYQVSNQKTLGMTEEDIVKNVSSAVEQIVKNEKVARKMLLDNNEITLRDTIMRAYGMLTNAYAIGGKEFMEKLAFVKLGVYYGFLKCSDLAELDGLVEKCRPANLMLKEGRTMSAEERDVCRAAFVSSELRSLVH